MRTITIITLLGLAALGAALPILAGKEAKSAKTMTAAASSQIERGKYIVTFGGCNDCHTAPSFAEGGNPFNGEPEKINTAVYLAGGQFFGPFVSKNLTPDSTGKPAGLTYGEFKILLRTGHDPDTGQLLQVMPWPAFGKWNDHDMLAVYNYLRAIPPLPNNY